MRRRLFALITRARHDLAEAAEELAMVDVNDTPNEDFEQDLLEARARVLALEARVQAIEQRSAE
jgi:hypothetical protein